MKQAAKEIYREIQQLLAKANTVLDEDEYEEFLDEVGADVDGRLEGIEADRREREDDDN